MTNQDDEIAKQLNSPQAITFKIWHLDGEYSEVVKLVKPIELHKELSKLACDSEGRCLHNVYAYSADGSPLSAKYSEYTAYLKKGFIVSYYEEKGWFKKRLVHKTKFFDSSDEIAAQEFKAKQWARSYALNLINSPSMVKVDVRFIVSNQDKNTSDMPIMLAIDNLLKGD